MYDKGVYKNLILQRFDKKLKNSKRDGSLVKPNRSVESGRNVKITIRVDEKELRKSDFQEKYIIKSEIMVAVNFGLHMRNQAERDKFLTRTILNNKTPLELELSSRIRINRAFESVGKSNGVTRQLYKSNNNQPEILADIMQKKNIYNKASGNSTQKQYYDYCQEMDKKVDKPNIKPEIGFYNLKAHFDPEKTATEKRLKIDIKEKNKNLLEKLISRRDPSSGQKRPLNDFNHQETGSNFV